MNKTCLYPQCQNCEFEYCVRDAQKTLKKTSKPRDRSEYQHKYYEKTKVVKKAKYLSKTKYVKYIEVRKTINRLKKQIGEVNCNLLLDAIEQIEKECLER